MSERDDTELDDTELFKEHAAEIEAAAARVRAVGTLLPTGASRTAPYPPDEARLPRPTPSRPEQPLAPEHRNSPERPAPPQRPNPMNGQLPAERPIPVEAVDRPIPAMQPERLTSQGYLRSAERPAAPERPILKDASIRFAHAPQPERSVPMERVAPQERIGAHDPVVEANSPGVQRAASILRAALPVVQRLMPLFDRNAELSGKTPAAQTTQPAGASPSGRVSPPLEEGLAELRLHQHGLRLQLAEQTATIKRVEERLENVREATDRNTLDQQEILEELRALGKHMRIAAIVALVLAAGGFCLALAFFLQLYKLQL